MMSSAWYKTRKSAASSVSVSPSRESDVFALTTTQSSACSDSGRKEADSLWDIDLQSFGE